MKNLSKSEAAAVFAALGVVGLLFLGGIGYVYSVYFNSPEVKGPGFVNISNPLEQKMPNGLIIKDIVVGSGAEAVAGKTVFAKYTGKFADGTIFDSSDLHGGDPLPFVLGAGQVIKGWDMGVEGMKVGGKRTLTVPPELGYGNSNYGPIPAGSTLIFDIELVDVR